jgi:poly-gamma-glutamate synthesis protein (capsule biosynthesis protein)
LEEYPWIYQRSEFDSAGEVFELVFVGDILAGRSAEPRLSFEIPAAFQKADLLVGNLEGVIADFTATVAPERAPYHLAGDSETAFALASAGFDLLGVANNHALDLKEPGLKATVQILEQAGIAWVGAGERKDQANQAWLRQFGSQRLAILAVNAVPSPQLSQSQPGWLPAAWEAGFIDSVQKARTESDLVIVMIHWGYEYQRQVDPAQRSIAQQCLEAGADFVIGSHPHVIQDLQVIPGDGQLHPKVIAYSLGNFVFDQGAVGNHDGMALRITLDHEGVRGVQAIPLQAGIQPMLIPPATAQAIVSQQLQAESNVAFECSPEACNTISIPDLSLRQVKGGVFGSGQSDLTGDLTAEQVRRESEQVIVYQEGVEAWRTPASWRILDAALGDPDWDGRNEIILAMLKPNDDGVLRSHPFIMGYRGGIFRNLWGGSAVGDPILEIELGNIDETPESELIVLEERDSGLRAITVWDWHGWGFSLRWRSAEANYYNLRLALDASDQPAWVVASYR